VSEKTAYVVDFDGTVTAVDLSTELARHFGGERFLEIENQYRQRKLGMRGWLDNMSALLPADFKLLLDFALKQAVLRPGFKDFLVYAREKGRPVSIASDGFGFYIEPILEKFGCLEYIDVVNKNTALPRDGGALRIETPHRHATCPVCGNCKAGHVLKLKKDGWRVVFTGDGSNDRFGASWSDQIFARDRLAHYCREHGVPFHPWEDFYDLFRDDSGKRANNSSDSPFCRPEGEGYLY
jgi:2-hydroxy-3-keto-5-methylthiopentenyl-1-phosphate phosphatase